MKSIYLALLFLDCVKINPERCITCCNRSPTENSDKVFYFWFEPSFGWFFLLLIYSSIDSALSHSTDVSCEALKCIEINEVGAKDLPQSACLICLDRFSFEGHENLNMSSASNSRQHQKVQFVLLRLPLFEKLSQYFRRLKDERKSKGL